MKDKFKRKLVIRSSKTESAKAQMKELRAGRRRKSSNTEISQSRTPPVVCTLPKFAGSDMGIH